MKSLIPQIQFSIVTSLDYLGYHNICLHYYCLNFINSIIGNIQLLKLLCVKKFNKPQNVWKIRATNQKKWKKNGGHCWMNMCDRYIDMYQREREHKELRVVWLDEMKICVFIQVMEIPANIIYDLLEIWKLIWLWFIILVTIIHISTCHHHPSTLAPNSLNTIYMEHISCYDFSIQRRMSITILCWIKPCM